MLPPRDSVTIEELLKPEENTTVLLWLLTTVLLKTFSTSLPQLMRNSVMSKQIRMSRIMWTKHPKFLLRSSDTSVLLCASWRTTVFPSLRSLYVGRNAIEIQSSSPCVHAPNLMQGIVVITHYHRRLSVLLYPPPPKTRPRKPYALVTIPAQN